MTGPTVQINNIQTSAIAPSPMLTHTSVYNAAFVDALNEQSQVITKHLTAGIRSGACYILQHALVDLLPGAKARADKAVLVLHDDPEFTALLPADEEAFANLFLPDASIENPLSLESQRYKAFISCFINPAIGAMMLDNGEELLCTELLRPNPEDTLTCHVSKMALLEALAGAIKQLTRLEEYVYSAYYGYPCQEVPAEVLVDYPEQCIHINDIEQGIL